MAEEQTAERITEHSVVALRYPITLWEVGDGAGLVYSSEATEVAHQLRLELSTLI